MLLTGHGKSFKSFKLAIMRQQIKKLQEAEEFNHYKQLREGKYSTVCGKPEVA